MQAAGDAHRGGTLRMHRTTSTPSIPRSATRRPRGNSFQCVRRARRLQASRRRRREHDRPDLASAVPTPTDNGRTYTFRLREGIRFSDGSALQASAVRSSLERIFKAHSPVSGYYKGILGGPACSKKPERCGLSKGVVTDDKTGSVTIKLSEPDLDFSHQARTDVRVSRPSRHTATGETPIPGTGPYRIAEHIPGRASGSFAIPTSRCGRRRLSRKASPTRSLLQQVKDTHAGVTAVERGEEESGPHLDPPDRLERLRTLLRGSAPRRATATQKPHRRVEHQPATLRQRERAPSRAGGTRVDREQTQWRSAAGRSAASDVPSSCPLGTFPASEPYCPYTVGARERRRLRRRQT